MQTKLFYILPAILGLCAETQAQIAIGDSLRPHASAMLDLNIPAGLNNRGVLFPLIPLQSATDRTSIPSPDDFLLVFTPYPAATPQAGLNYWFNNRWNHLLNQTDTYKLISNMHVAQAVLLAELKVAEKNKHITDQNAQTPYTLPLDQTIFDSQNSYDKVKYEYLIQETDFYEITCDVALTDVTPGLTMQCFIRINGVNVVNDIVSSTSSTVTASVVYIAKLNKGDSICSAVGVGNWGKDAFRIRDASLTIVKY